MGWERRQRGGTYYYRAVRVDGKPRRVYLGTGALGLMHERLDLAERRAREAALADRRRAAAQLAEAEAWAWLRVLATAELLTCGMYNHNGEWRRAREPPRTRHTNSGPATPEAEAELQAELAALSRRANAGDDVALARLRAVLDEHPEVWRGIGDLTRLSVISWTGMIAGRDALGREALLRHLHEWKGELAGPDPSPTERALADAAGVARLALAHAEFAAPGAGDPPPVAAAKARRIDSAVHRLAATLKLLAQVRAARGRGQAPASPPAAGVPRIYAPPGRQKRVG